MTNSRYEELIASIDHSEVERKAQLQHRVDKRMEDFESLRALWGDLGFDAIIEQFMAKTSHTGIVKVDVEHTGIDIEDDRKRRSTFHVEGSAGDGKGDLLEASNETSGAVGIYLTAGGSGRLPPQGPLGLGICLRAILFRYQDVVGADREAELTGFPFGPNQVFIGLGVSREVDKSEGWELSVSSSSWDSGLGVQHRLKPMERLRRKKFDLVLPSSVQPFDPTKGAQYRDQLDVKLAKIAEKIYVPKK